MVQNVTFGQEVKTPIWLNADILPGSCYDKVCVPVDHARFLSLCKSYFPNGTLSISWTTGKNTTAVENFYNWSQVLPMGKLVSQIAQPITFPVRANLVQRSWKQLHWLLDLSETFTITIWSSTMDNPDVQDLVALRYNVSDKRRIYYDLPLDQEKAFKDALASSSDRSKGESETFPWKATATKDCKDVLTGHNSAVRCFREMEVKLYLRKSCTRCQLVNFHKWLAQFPSSGLVERTAKGGSPSNCM